MRGVVSTEAGRSPWRADAARLLLALLTAGCTTGPSCPPGTTPTTVAQLFLGRAVEGRDFVDAEAWSRFLDTEATPRFPHGLTVLDAEGRWRSPTGAQEREASRVLLLVLPGRTAKEVAPAVAALAAAYRERFRQQGVLVTLHAACAGA